MLQSLDSNRDKENKENAEFEAQRKDAIAEAARGGAKKIFGGGNKSVSMLYYSVCSRHLIHIFISLWCLIWMQKMLIT
jgi:hypothetical protein